MEKIKILSIIFSIILLGCNSSQNYDSTIKKITYDDFQKTENLQYEILPLDSIWKPTRIFCTDNKLILIDQTQDFFAQIFDLEKNIKICENLPFGVGPQESVDCWTLEIMKDYILSFSLQTCQLKKYLKNQFLEKSNINNITTIDVGKYHPSAMVLLSNNKLVASSLEDTQNSISLFDSLGNIFNNNTSFPKLESTKNFNEFERKRAFENRIYYNDYNNKIIVAYTYTDIIDIYNNDLQLISRIQGPIGFDPIMADNNDYFGPSGSCTKISCLTGCLTKNYIWLVYQKGNNKDLPTQILVYDFNGNPINVINTNIGLMGIAVDEENNTIYSLADVPERSVIKFKYNINE